MPFESRIFFYLPNSCLTLLPGELSDRHGWLLSVWGTMDGEFDGDIMTYPLQQGNGAFQRNADREWTLYFLMKIPNQMLKECHESRKYIGYINNYDIITVFPIKVESDVLGN